MASLHGREQMRQFIRSVPAQFDKALPGAARAGAKVIAKEAEDNSKSARVDQAIKVRVSRETGNVVAKIQVRGPGAYIANWLEYGTSAHFISVDDSQREGRSVGRINWTASEEGGGRHSLVIGGQFVGATVLHPGARPHPFFRPAFDTKEVEAFAVAQAYLDSRVTKTGVLPAEPDGDDD